VTAVSTCQPFSVAQWLNAMYCHPARPSALQRDVLTALVVKFMDWGTGTGYASIEMIAEFTRHTRSTVKRALRWGHPDFPEPCPAASDGAGMARVRRDQVPGHRAQAGAQADY